MVTYMMSLTASSARRAALALVLLACAAFCPPGVAAPGAKKGVAKKPSAPLNLSGSIESPTIQIGDPKLPGKLLAVVKGNVLGVGPGGGGELGTMTQVHALLYQKGRQAATFDAPVAHISQNNATKNVVAVGTGGVVIKSLIEPGTRLTADIVTWYAGLNRIVATGHVVYHNGKSGWDVLAPTMTADTQLHSVSGAKGRAFGKF